MSDTPTPSEPVEPQHRDGGALEPIEAVEPSAADADGAPDAGHAHPVERIEYDEPVLTTDVDDETVTVRRSPRYGSFMLAGGVLGAVIALILTFAFPENEQFDRGQVFGFLLIALGAIGVGFAALIALALDRAFSRHPTSAIAEHEATHTVDD
ncbi:hypothetical protein ACGGZK_05955 [Agromyces sp. MMS24-K17]|uniref:hypothetical protein n=1 Tax=Agromyces sp. MMS24-K17 TaxID=3372850 RepID=UPI0037551E45